MGGDFYTVRTVTATASKQTFSNAAATTLAKVKTLHNDLNPKNVGNIKTSGETPIVLCCDVSGSMGDWPKVIWDKLPMLYGQMMMQGYCDDPSISFCASGDAGGDRAPLQVTKFCSGNAIEDAITKIYIEGGGGGAMGSHETYELPAYYYSRKVAVESKAKPFFFFIADEFSYPAVKKDHVKKLIGDNIESDIPTQEIFEELRQKYHVFLLHKFYAGKDAKIVEQWSKLLGSKNRILRLDNPKACVDVILGVISVVSGTRTHVEYVKDLETRGQEKERIELVKNCIKFISKGGEAEGDVDEDDAKAPAKAPAAKAPAAAAPAAGCPPHDYVQLAKGAICNKCSHTVGL